MVFAGRVVVGSLGVNGVDENLTGDGDVGSEASTDGLDSVTDEIQQYYCNLSNSMTDEFLMS